MLLILIILEILIILDNMLLNSLILYITIINFNFNIIDFEDNAIYFDYFINFPYFDYKVVAILY
jgi:hypothetical protein